MQVILGLDSGRHSLHLVIWDLMMASQKSRMGSLYIIQEYTG